MNAKDTATATTAPAMPPEQAAALAELEAQAATNATTAGPAAIAANEGNGDTPAPGQRETPPVDLAAEIEGLIELVIGMLSFPMPKLNDIWTKETMRQAAEKAAAVCIKRGWLQGGITGGFTEEMALLLTVGPLLLASFKVYRDAQAEAAKAAQSAIDTAKATAAVSSFGTVAPAEPVPA